MQENSTKSAEVNKRNMVILQTILLIVPQSHISMTKGLRRDEFADYLFF